MQQFSSHKFALEIVLDEIGDDIEILTECKLNAIKVTNTTVNNYEIVTVVKNL